MTDSGENTSLYFLLSFSGSKTNLAKSDRNLGVIFDKNFTFRSHTSAFCSSCWLPYPGFLGCIRHCLDLNGAKLLATGLLSSCLDYCNSHLHGIADTDLTKLQRVQNWLACVVTKSSLFTHSVPWPHWLPVQLRILFKISLLTYKTIHEKQPAYLPSIALIPFTEITQRN